MDFTKKPFYLKEEDIAWVENTFASMTQEEKLNQVFVDMLWNNSPKELEALQSGYQLGGFRYNNMSPEKLYEQNETIQKVSKIPALIAANVEAGGNGELLVGFSWGDTGLCGVSLFGTASENNAGQHQEGQQGGGSGAGNSLASSSLGIA